jgi:hypothetical protein
VLARRAPVAVVIVLTAGVMEAGDAKAIVPTAVTVSTSPCVVAASDVGAFGVFGLRTNSRSAVPEDGAVKFIGFISV